MPTAPSGNRNLLAKTNQGKTNWVWSVSKGSYSAETVDVDGISAVKLTRTSAETSSWSVIEYQGLIRNLIEADTDYTLSFDVYPNVDVTLIATLARGNSQFSLTNSKTMNTAPAEQWTKVSATLHSHQTLPEESGQLVYSRGMPVAKDNYLIIKNIKLEKGENQTPYSQAPEDLGWSMATLVPTQQQRYLWKFEYVYYSDGSVEMTGPVNLSIAGADADTTGITDAINQTNQTVTGLQNSVSQAQSDLATVSSNLTQARQDLEDSIASVNTKAQAVETTLAQVQSTANANSQKTATLENNLDGLSARFSSLKIGGRNYFKNSKSQIYTITSASTQDYRLYIYDEFWNNIERFKQDFVRVSFDISVEPALTSDFYTALRFGASPWHGSKYFAIKPNTTEPQHFDLTIDLSSAADTFKSNNIFIRFSNALGVGTVVKLTNINLYLSDVPTDYSPNEADLEQTVAEYKQNADQNYASLQTTVQNLDGTVQQNKTVADQTAAGFQTRIESLETYKDGETTRANQYFESAKTETARQLTAERTAIANDYVAKSTYTSDVSGIRSDLSQVQTTADTTKTNLASYQASNDQTVASLQSSLQTTDGNVSSLQTQINAVPGQIMSAVSAVEGKIAGSLVGQNLYIKSTSVKGFLPATGGAGLGGQNAVNKEVTSDFIRVTENEKYVFQGWITVPDGNYSWRAWQFYDVDKQPISNRQTPGFNVTTDEDNVSHFQHIITMPTNVKYIRISARLYSDGKLKFEKGSVATDYSLAPEDTATQISSLSSQIQQTADGMTLLATKTELNTAKTELQSGISTATSKADNAQATADSNAQTISTHTTQISALNTGLQAKVSQSDFDSLSGRVTTAESNLTATANQLSSQISSVNERIPTSKDFKNLYVISNSSDGFLAYGSTDLGAANPVYRECTSDYIPVEAGEKYAFQVWATLTENQQGWRAWQFYNEDKSLNGGRTAGNYTSDYQCVQQTLTVPTNAKWMRVSARMYNDGKIMVEKGNEYHDYMLAPEDAISDAALTQAKSEIKQTTDAITASVSSVETKANTAQSTANTAVSKADAAQTAVNTLDSTTVKSASLNLDNNGFVTKVGKTIDGNKFATMIAQDANNVKIIADEMQVTANMIVDGAVTAEKLNVSNLSAVNSNLGKIEGGSLLLQENKTASSSVDNWGTFNRPAHKQGLYMDNHGLASSGAIQRKNGSETTPTDMPLAVLQSGELRFLVVDYNDNLENVLHYGLSDPDYGAIRFEIDSELKRRLTMTSSGYLNFQATNYTNWQSTGVSGCEYMIQGRLVLVNYDVTFSSAGTHTIGGIPQEFTKKSLMMTAKAWTITPRDKNIQLNSDGSLHILDAEANVNYRGTLVFSY